MTARFRLGQEIVATPAALRVMGDLGTDGLDLLKRHAEGDWGDVDDHDKRLMEHAVEHGGTLMSVYGTDRATKLYVITEHDRSVTTILTPSDY